VTNNNLINAGDLPPGFLNKPMREKAYESFTRGALAATALWMLLQSSCARASVLIFYN
jgi:hypothetical protein